MRYLLLCLYPLLLIGCGSDPFNDSRALYKQHTATHATWGPYADQPAITLSGEDANLLWQWVISSPKADVSHETPDLSTLTSNISFTLHDGSNISLPTQTTGIGDRLTPFRPTVFISFNGEIGAIENSWPAQWLKEKVKASANIPLWLPAQIIHLNDPNHKLNEKIEKLSSHAMKAWKDGDLELARTQLKAVVQTFPKEQNAIHLLDILDQIELGLLHPTWQGLNGMETGNPIDFQSTFPNGWWETTDRQVFNKKLETWANYAPEDLAPQLIGIIESPHLNTNTQHQLLGHITKKWHQKDVHNKTWETAASLNDPFLTALIRKIYPPQSSTTHQLLINQVTEHIDTPFKPEIASAIKDYIYGHLPKNFSQSEPILQIATNPNSSYQSFTLQHLLSGSRKKQFIKIAGHDFPQSREARLLFINDQLRNPKLYNSTMESWKDLIDGMLQETSDKSFISQLNSASNGSAPYFQILETLGQIAEDRNRHGFDLDNEVRSQIKDQVKLTFEAFLTHGSKNTHLAFSNAIASYAHLSLIDELASKHGVKWFEMALLTDNSRALPDLTSDAFKLLGEKATPLVQNTITSALSKEEIEPFFLRRIAQNLIQHISTDDTHDLLWKFYNHSHQEVISTGMSLLVEQDTLNIEKFLNRRTELSKNLQESAASYVVKSPAITAELLAKWLLLENDRPLAKAALHALRKKTEIPFEFTHGRITKKQWIAKRQAWLDQLIEAGVVKATP